MNQDPSPGPPPSNGVPQGGAHSGPPAGPPHGVPAGTPPPEPVPGLGDRIPADPPARKLTAPVIVAIAAVVLVAVLCLVCGAIGVTRLNETAGDHGLGGAQPTPVVPTAPDVRVHVAPEKPKPIEHGPVDQIPGDGTYLVDVDVKAGEYRTRVPETSILCYWERLAGTGGEFAELIASGDALPGTPEVVTISHSDKAFRSRGCGAWRPV